jgi:arylsulfatase A-like enzyme
VRNTLERRDFLKLISLLPLIASKWPSRIDSQVMQSSSLQTPNVLILVFDALSAQHISLYGYPRETMPNLSRFAERATVYHNHYSGGNFTSPGTASLLTGTYPWTHRAIHLHGTVSDRIAHRNIFNLFNQQRYNRLGYSHNLLVTNLLYQFKDDLDVLKWTRELCLVDDQFADRLFPGDYNVAYASEWLQLSRGNREPTSLFLSIIHQFLRSVRSKEIMKEYGDEFPKGIPNHLNEYFILEDAINWLVSELENILQPFFLYFHVLPPHSPYTSRREFIDMFDDDIKFVSKPARFFSQGKSDKFLYSNRQEYDEYIAYADAEFGRLYDSMLENGMLDNTILAVTADHGEMFERSIWGHLTPALYQPIIHIPLLISSPGQAQREDIHTQTSCVDLLPTLLKLTHQPIPDWCEGEILPPYSDSVSTSVRPVFSVEGKKNPKHGSLNIATFAVINEQYKLIYYSGYDDDVPECELFDLANDPQEMIDLAATKRTLATDLRALLMDKLKSVEDRS